MLGISQQPHDLDREKHAAAEKKPIADAFETLPCPLPLLLHPAPRALGLSAELLCVARRWGRRRHFAGVEVRPLPILRRSRNVLLHAVREQLGFARDARPLSRAR